MKIHFLLIYFILFLSSCIQQPGKKNQIANAPYIFASKGYTVPTDSTSDATVIPVDEKKLSKIRVGIPKIVPTNTNIHPAGFPKIVLAGKPKVSTPGQDNFLMPKSIPAAKSSIIAGIPEVKMAKDPAVKDLNPGNFSSFGKLQGLNNAYIFCMLEDKSGNLWFGTDGGGVSKYDGRSFTHYTDKEGLTTNNVVSLGEDQDGNIWIGSFGYGVTRFDGKSFTHFTEKEGLSSNNIFSIVKDKKGNLWFGTYGGGATRYDGKLFTHFTQLEGLSGNIIYSILEDKAGNIWFATYGGGASKYDGKSFTNYTMNEGLSSNNLWIITEDKIGNLWFGTDGGGVSKYDGTYFTHFTEKEGLPGNNVFNITEDKSGNLWFAIYGEGITMYDGNTVSKRSPAYKDPGLANNRASFSNYKVTEGLANNIVFSILKDKNENMWFATFGGGVSKYDGKLFTHFTEKEGLSNPIVYSILEDTKGNMWFGTGEGGISVYKDQSTFLHYTTEQGLPTDKINTIIEDQKGNIWFGTDGKGVMKYNPHIERGGIDAWTQYAEKDGLSHNVVRSILEDTKGNIWIGTFGGGVSKYNAAGANGTFTHFTTDQGLSNNFVWSVSEDRAGNMWFGTFGGGASKYDGKSFTHFTVKEGLMDNMVRSILEDKNGNIWFATGAGISMYDGKAFIHFTEKQGLVDPVVYSILEDKTGNLWFGTRLGLSKLTPLKLSDYLGLVDETNEEALVPAVESAMVALPNNRLFKNYSYEDGFLGIGCFANSICEDKNGTIWIGANDRLTAFHPEGDWTDTLAPNIQLTGLALFNENLNWVELEKNRDTSFVLGNGVRVGDFKFDGVTKWYAMPEHLSLAYNTNFLTFNFIGITQKSPKKVTYRYKLDGMDDHWSAITTRTEAPYGNLPPGKYAFKVKAMNGEGYWSNEFIYEFVIRPPWWLTWWAFSIYLLLLIGGILGFIYLRSAALRKENKVLEEKVELRTSQLKTSIENLKSTQNQLIQSEKMASLGELTAGIAHEIQNPLNFVNNFSEVNTELIEELKVERSKVNGERNVPMEDDLIDTIRENGLKINHHGKRADTIVKGMLEHSRKSTGVKEPTDINKLCDEFVRLSYHGLRAKDKSFNCDYKIDLDPNLPLVNVISQDIGRVLLNVINNAFQACAERHRSACLQQSESLKSKSQKDYKPLVVLTTKFSASMRPRLNGEVGQVCEICISDNGPGIPPHIKDKIFQPFFTTKPTGQGTGLGLSLAYDIVKAHGGDIKVVSNENEGTEFIITLPI